MLILETIFSYKKKPLQIKVEMLTYVQKKDNQLNFVLVECESIQKNTFL